MKDFICLCFFFNDTATTEIYTLSLHDALPILFAISCRYAYDILELEELNRRLEDHLSVVQAYSKELSLEQGLEIGRAHV